jgi:3-hydroxyacyl-CoA dehydrogenase
VPVVEICGAPWTSKDAIEQARSVYESIGQTPVTVNREIEGFVLNRLQSVVLAEALRLVAEGVVSPQDLDHTMKDGLGLRWAFMGPLETIELNAPDGMADYLRRYGSAFGRIASTPADPTVWEQPNVERLVAAWGKPGREALKEKMDWRDATLAALVAHKKTNARPPH